MANQICIRGFVSSDFEMQTTPTGLVVGKFRMGSNTRKLDRVTNQWSDGPTNWYRVTTFRGLAQNAVATLHKGDRVLVMGKLKIENYLRKDGTQGTSVEIEAESIGPDLAFGAAHYSRMVSARPLGQGTPPPTADPFAEERSRQGGAGGDVHSDEEPPDTDESERVSQEVGGDGGEDGSSEAAPNQPGGLRDDQHVDLETGEVLEDAVPY